MKSARRWTAARKEELLAEIRADRLTRDQAMVLHQLSAEELASWEERFARYGQAGLALTNLQELRP